MTYLFLLTYDTFLLKIDTIYIAKYVLYQSISFYLVLNQNLKSIRLVVKLNHCNFATETESPKVKFKLNKKTNSPKNEKKTTWDAIIDRPFVGYGIM